MNAAATDTRTPVLSAKRLVKTYGHVVGLDGVSLDLYAGEVLAIIGDNGAGKTTLIKCLTGAEIPDEGELRLDGREVSFRRPQDARDAGIETVYQSLAVSPALDVAANMYLGRELRRSGPLGSVFRMLDTKTMRANARAELTRLGISTLQDVSVAIENLSGGQRQAVAAWIQIGRDFGSSPNAAVDANLNAITAVVIGGISLFGGRGNVWGTLLGALIVGVFRNGLALAGLDVLYQTLAVGILVIVAVSIDQWIRKVRK